MSPLTTWQNFYTIIGSAAATLTGLMFVVVTLIAQVRVRVLSMRRLRHSTRPTSGILASRCWSPQFSVHPGRRSGLLVCCWASAVSGG